MSLKSTLIFSILLLTPLTAFGLTDDEVMAKYANPQDLQNAIDRGEVDYNSLSPTIQKVTHPMQNHNDQQHKSLDIPSNLWILFPIIIGLFLVKLTIKFVTTNKHSKSYKSEDSINLNHSILARILLTLRIIKVKRPIGKTELDKIEPKKTKTNRTYPKGFDF